MVVYHKVLQVNVCIVVNIISFDNGRQSRKMKFVILKKIYFINLANFILYDSFFFCFSCEISSFYPNLSFSGAPLWSKISWSIGQWPTKRSHDGRSAVLPSRSRYQSLELIFSAWNASFKLQESGWIKSWFPSEEYIPFRYIGGSNGPFCTSSMIHKLWTIANTSGLLSMLTQQNTLLVWLSI